jgi:hypothetical protein
VKPNPALGPLHRAIGAWRTTGHHPYLPGRTLHGRASFEWIEGGAFVAMRTRMDDPEIPAGVAIFGTDDDAQRASMLYFDERGVARKYDVEIRDEGFTWSRDAPSLSQRFGVTFADGAMRGRGEMSKDGVAWEKDLDLDYARIEAGGSR